MASKNLMLSLSRRLEPVREEFKIRLFHWSLGILNQQISDDVSLFWSVPSRVIRNLHQLLRADGEDSLRFVLIRHACRHQQVMSRLGQPALSPEDVPPLMNRCIDPDDSDVRKRGLLPLSMPVPRLNKRKLRVALEQALLPTFEETTDPAERGEWSYETRVGQWRLISSIRTSSRDFQLDFEFDVHLGMGDLYLERHLALHSLFGIGPSSWDLLNPGEEDKAAVLIGEYCRFMAAALSSLLVDLDPGISNEEVRQAEQEWKQWLSEMRAERANMDR